MDTHLSKKTMERRPRKQSKLARLDSEEVSSVEWKFIKMSPEEEDLIYRMYRLVGERWELIAGRIPGRRAEEIERFWLMRHHHAFAHYRNFYNKFNSNLSKF